ncbi:uncharacterized protein BDZ99DRAFT_500638 [Mytilinidion resinicola]|uniref:Uncharacterized protein n=1 Tax=Mytilinidion resinicola TaxID=574789 RepID=A0A6A6YF38_9PEZI|nr:uncharacterized protein BDZ99DRAFT_500638 [Mytilinidion resinicola]KAF2807446.1 hypothetical protein BDZ99DRAFT_500638 [Mytilinidion resinicola]
MTGIRHVPLVTSRALDHRHDYILGAPPLDTASNLIQECYSPAWAAWVPWAAGLLGATTATGRIVKYVGERRARGACKWAWAGSGRTFSCNPHYCALKKRKRRVTTIPQFDGIDLYTVPISSPKELWTKLRDNSVIIHHGQYTQNGNVLHIGLEGPRDLLEGFGLILASM